VIVISARALAHPPPDITEIAAHRLPTWSDEVIGKGSVYNRDRALCHRLDATDAPRLDRCQPSCANIARTDHHAADLLAQAEVLEKQSASTVLPGPLADRLVRRAGQLRELADRHEHDRIHPQEPTS
jgi:hypothetical protein